MIGTARKALYNLDEWNDTHGGSRCALKGDILIVREESPYTKGLFYVSHPARTDGMTFAAHDDELDPQLELLL